MASPDKADHDEFIRNLLGLSGESVSNVDSRSVEDEINRLDNIISTSSVQTHSCTKCGKRFLTKKSLARHLKEVDCKSKKTVGHVCDLCAGKTFANAFSLRRHVRSVHGRQRPDGP